MYDIFFINWLNSEADIRFSQLWASGRRVVMVSISADLTTLIKQCAAQSQTEKYWVISSLNDYTNFDFEQTIDPHHIEFMQVHPNDTWLIDVDYVNELLPSDSDIHSWPNKHFPDNSTVIRNLVPLDIVYISNGEPDAESNWQRLLASTQGLPNRVVRIKDINGRVAAYHAAARASNTAWFFAVFAKLEISADFQWHWHPGIMHGAKHWIFTAKNPVNDLEYGHMAMIAYSKFLTLDTVDPGLDFIMSRPCMYVPISSGVARFNQNAITTWRTAFREVVKLKGAVDSESAHRLHTWRTVAHGNYAKWSLMGARDAVNYYDSVRGEHSKLMLSFDWQWLNDYFERTHANTDSATYSTSASVSSG